MRSTPLARGLAAAVVLATGFASVAPALAASDVDTLKEYVGDWRGRGTLTGANTETIVCRLSMTEGNQDKVNYAGRCTLAGTTLAMNGTVAYIAAKKRFEAAITSNTSFGGTAIGLKRGNTIVFDFKDKQQDEEGNDMNISSQMVLGGGKINVQFQVVFVSTGDMIKATVPFSQ